MVMHSIQYYSRKLRTRTRTDVLSRGHIFESNPYKWIYTQYLTIQNKEKSFGNQ